MKEVLRFTRTNVSVKYRLREPRHKTRKKKDNRYMTLMRLLPKLCYIDCLLNLSDKTVKPSGSCPPLNMLSLWYS